MKRASLAALAALLLLLPACGAPEPEPTPTPTPTPVATPTPEPTPTPYNGPVSPLSGLPMGEEWVNRRPVAVMLNNLKEALPQLGQSMADIIYEVPAEGGITRMLGVYQSLDGVGTIGSIRSARPYYLELALGHDAIFLPRRGQRGRLRQDPPVGGARPGRGQRPLSGQQPGSNLMWRDPERRKSYSLEHTVVTTGETIMELLPTYSLRLSTRRATPTTWTSCPTATPANGAPAGTITVPVSHYKTGCLLTTRTAASTWWRSMASLISTATPANRWG